MNYWTCTNPNCGYDGNEAGDGRVICTQCGKRRSNNAVAARQTASVSTSHAGSVANAEDVEGFIREHMKKLDAVNAGKLFWKWQRQKVIYDLRQEMSDLLEKERGALGEIYIEGIKVRAGEGIERDRARIARDIRSEDDEAVVDTRIRNIRRVNHAVSDLQRDRMNSIFGLADEMRDQFLSRGYSAEQADEAVAIFIQKEMEKLDAMPTNPNDLVDVNNTNPESKILIPRGRSGNLSTDD